MVDDTIDTKPAGKASCGPASQRWAQKWALEPSSPEERWHSLFDTAPELFCIVGPDGTVQYSNRALGELSADQSIGTRACEYLLPEHRDKFQQSIESVLGSGELTYLELGWMGPHGNHEWHCARLSPYIRGGQAVAVVVVSTDITEIKRSEQMAKSGERRLRLLLEQMPAVLWTTDIELRVTSIQGSGSLSLPLHPRQFIGTTLHDGFGFKTTEGDIPPIKAHQRAVGGESVAYEVEYWNRTYDARVEPLRGLQGVIVGTLGVALDTTERKQAEEVLRRSDRLAALGTLAAGIAHEINNPIGGALIAAQHALASMELPSSQEIVRSALQDIELDAKRCGRIVKSILRFARQESSRKSPCSLNDIVRSAIALTRKQAQDSGAVVEFQPNEALPNLLVNRTDMEQALANLIRNAVESGNDNIHVLIQTKCGAGRVHLTVRDNGAGINQEHRKHIFDPFYTTRPGEGTGLGLSLTHSIISDHGGKIDVESALGEGTTFSAELPLSPQKGGELSHESTGR